MKASLLLKGIPLLAIVIYALVNGSLKSKLFKSSNERGEHPKTQSGKVASIIYDSQWNYVQVDQTGSLHWFAIQRGEPVPELGSEAEFEVKKVIEAHESKELIMAFEKISICKWTHSNEAHEA